MTYQAPYVRVFFNRAKDSKNKVWSVDTGPGTPELLATVVELIGVDTVTVYDPDQTPDNIRAWIEMDNVVVESVGLVVTIKQLRNDK